MKSPHSETPERKEAGERSRVSMRILRGIALLISVTPLWVVRDIPMVDMPQHLYVLDVLNRLDRADTAYSQWFVAGFSPTPYLGYYVVVHLLSQVMQLELANRIFITSMILAWPLSLSFLLGSLGRPRWPALLAAPCAYGDSFGWGFVNTMTGMTLALLARSRGPFCILLRGSLGALHVRCLHS